MNEKEVAMAAINLLLTLPWNKRADAIAAIQHNDIFCWHCGMGEVSSPNAHCQCWNDE